MKPYYDDESVTLYHGDSREIVSTLGYIPAVVTDPPYGVGMASYNDDFTTTTDVIDRAEASIAAVFTSPRRVVELANSLFSWNYKRILTMHKAADMAAPWHGWCMNSETIAIFSRSDGRSVWPSPSDYRSDVYTTGPWERVGHPSSKPLAVIVDLVRRVTSTEVLDPFCGSGTTLVAAKRLGVRAVGIEIDERYCEIAASRLSQGVLDFGAAS